MINTVLPHIFSWYLEPEYSPDSTVPFPSLFPLSPLSGIRCFPLHPLPTFEPNTVELHIFYCCIIISAVINKFSINCSIQNLGFANMIHIGGPFLVRFSYDRPVGNTYTRRSKQWVGDSFSLYRGRDTKKCQATEVWVGK